MVDWTKIQVNSVSVDIPGSSELEYTINSAPTCIARAQLTGCMGMYLRIVDLIA